MADQAKWKRALELLSDPDNWIGDPTDVDAEFVNEQTPFELACEALADVDPADEASDGEETIAS